MSKDNGGPAFPEQTFEYDGQNNVLQYQNPGMTLREYACIHLRVPETEHDWLNELIRKSQRDEFAAKAMQGICVSKDESGTLVAHGYEWIADEAYAMADAMLKAREQ